MLLLLIQMDRQRLNFLRTKSDNSDVVFVRNFTTCPHLNFLLKYKFRISLCSVNWQN